jgi:hypothetical protein
MGRRFLCTAIPSHYFGRLIMRDASEQSYWKFPLCFPQCLDAVMMRHSMREFLSENPLLGAAQLGRHLVYRSRAIAR